MNLQKQPNHWSCNLASMAMVLDVHYRELIEEIGHDGSEILYPDLPEPLCRRGFHMQELIDCAVTRFFTCSEIQIRPVGTPDGLAGHEHEIDFKISHEERFKKYLDLGYNALLYGMTRKCYHCVAWEWDTKLIHDPNGRVYGLNDCKIKLAGLYLIV